MKQVPDPRQPSPLLAALFTPVDAASIVFFRVAFGLLMVWTLKRYTLEEGYQFLTRPPVLFKFYGFEWVHPAPEWAMKLLFWAMTAAALCIAFGFLYRIAIVFFFVSDLYVFLLDSSRYNNHGYFICLLSFLLIFIPAYRRSQTMPGWALWLLRFQIGVPYFFGGLAKLNGDWLSRAQPMTLWLQEGGADVPEFLQTTWAGYAFSWGGLLFDLLVVPLLLWRPTRAPMFLFALAFHLTNATIFEIGVFPWLMICASTIYFPADWPRRVGLIGKLRGGGAPKKTPELTWGRKQRLTAGLLGAWVAVQILVPFRHFLYPGNVDWTEEGSHFAWRMKLRDKRGSVKLVVIDPRTRKGTIYEDLDTVLTRRQYFHMLHDPYLILQVAHYLARELERAGQKGIEVRAVTSISFNGREPQPIIDPNADLTTRRRKLGAADWIVPLQDRGGR